MALDNEDISSITKLKDSSTFSMWNFEIKILFKAKQLMDVVDGSSTMSTCGNDEAKISKWKAKDAMAQHAILRTIDKTVKLHLMNYESAKDMYDALFRIYQKDTNQEKCTLLQEFYNFKYDNTKNIHHNISGIQNLVFKLKVLQEEISENMIMSKILSILPEKHQYFSCAWDSTPTQDKTLENLIARLSAEEDKIKIKQVETPVSFKTVIKGKYEPTCHACGKKGHIKPQCPVKYKKQDNSTKPCTICKLMGHIRINHTERTCFNKDKACKICKKTNHKTEECFFDEKNKAKNLRNENSDQDKKISFLTHINETLNSEIQDVEMIVDSGCNKMMIKEENIILDMKKCSDKVMIAKKGDTIPIEGYGKIDFDTCTLNEVYYVPQLSRNLLSVNVVTQAQGAAYFDNEKVYILKTNIKIPEDHIAIEGRKTENGLYVVNMKKTDNNALITEDSNSTQIIDWHRKLGHLSYGQMRKIPELCDGVSFKIDTSRKMDCIICAKAKQVRLPFKTIRERANCPMQIIHTDIGGPIDPPTFDNKNYFLVFLDDYTHFCTVYLLETKTANEVFRNIQRFIHEGEAHFNLKVSKLRMDNGGEYQNNLLSEWCKNKGIIQDFTIPHTPQLNGKSERMMLTLLNKARALIFEANCEKEMWGEAILVAAYLTNRCPTKGVACTPYERWFKRKPNLNNLKIFGQKVYAKVLKPLKKLDSRSQEAMFVGYAPNGYRLWDQEERKTFIGRDVIFTNKFYMNIETKTEELINISFYEEEEIGNPEEEENAENEVEDINQNQEIQDDEENIQNEDRRPRREVKLPSRYNDFITNFDEIEALLTFEEAVNNDEWRVAIQEEKDSLLKNRTWIYVEENQAKGKEVLKCRWIFKIKDSGKYKARLVAKGCSQDRNSMDLEDIYSPVVDATSLRLLFAIAAKKNWSIQTVDVKTAFLYGELDEPVYMRVPEGFDQKGKVCLLMKSLYGLRQAPCQWNKRLTSVLKELNMIQLKSDQCIFKSEEGDMYLAIHVDDGIIVGQNKIKIKQLQDKLKKEFDMTVHENPKTYLGMDIKRIKEGLILNQENYVNKVLTRFKMQDSKPMKTPITQDIYKIDDADEQNETNVILNYREGIGSLLYLSCKTRPDLSFAVNYESRSTENPKKKDYVNLKRTLRYLKGTVSAGIFYRSNPDENEEAFHLVAYCDSDFAGDIDTRTKEDIKEIRRKSTSGYVITLFGSPISWSSRRQTTVAQSTMEAELIAACECTKELKYLVELLKELTGVEVKATLYIDNQSTIKLIKAGRMKRSRHIEVKYFFIKDEYYKNLFKMIYVPSDQNRFKVNLRNEWKYKDVALKDAAFETTNKKDYDTKYSQIKVCEKYPMAPSGNQNYMRNVLEKMVAAPPKPMVPKISEMKDNFRMNYAQPETREVVPPAITAICPVQGLGRDEEPPIRPENQGFWKWLDPYLTTNRSTYVQFSPNQRKDAKKDFPTYYNTIGKWPGFSDVLPPASGNKCIVDPVPFKNQLPNRIVPEKIKRVPNFGITSEYSAKYHINSRSDLSPYIQSPGEEFPESLSEASAWQNLAAPGMYCTEYCQIGTGRSSRNTIAVDMPKKNIVHKPCRIKFTDSYKYY